jgi:hypothetical protein
MSLSLPDPRDVTFERWGAELVLQDPRVPYPTADWRRWAASLNDVAQLDERAPDPYTFTNWRDWAAALRIVLP